MRCRRTARLPSWRGSSSASARRPRTMRGPSCRPSSRPRRGPAACVAGCCGMARIRAGGPLKKAKGHKVTLTEAEAVSYIRTWRNDNQRIVRFWYALHDAFRYAMDAPLGIDPIALCDGKLTLRRTDEDAVRITLPSGR